MRTAEEQRRKAVRLTSPSGFGSEGHDKLSVQHSTSFLGRPNNKTQCGVWGVWASVGGQQTSVNKRSVHLDKTQIFSFFFKRRCFDGADGRKSRIEPETDLSLTGR